MTRIILQRCFLLLAFTGILWTRAQESTPTPLSLLHTESKSASPQAAENSSVETASPPHSHGGASEEESSALNPTEVDLSATSLGGDVASSTNTEESGVSNPEPSDGPFRDGPGTNPPTSPGALTDAVDPVTVNGRRTETPEETTEGSSPDSPVPSTVPSTMDPRSLDPRSSIVVRDQRVSTARDAPPATTRSLDDATTTEGGDASSPTTSGTEDSAEVRGNGTERTPEVAPTTDDATHHDDADVAASSLDVAAVHSEKVEHLVDATQTSPISLAALSSLSEDSIQSSGSTAQASYSTLGESPRTTPAKFTEREFSDVAFELLVTFDPDGMTHNGPQEPDAVTFVPFRVDGTTGRPSVFPGSVRFTDETTHAFALLESNMKEDREREPLSPGPSPNFNRPDEEELSSKNALPGTPGVVPAANDESEEMMNDSPQFGPIQSKLTTPARVEELGEGSSGGNDLGYPTTGASSHHHSTKAASHELDFQHHHPSEPSEFRPVTVSPESATTLRKESSSSSDVSRPDQTESVLSTSPNADPANRSVEEAVTAAAATSQTDGGSNSTSSIAGVAVKTSVSVSLPLSNANSTVGAVAPDVQANVSGILPFPIHLEHNKDFSTQTPPPSPDTSTSGGLKIRKPKLKIGGSTDGPAESTPRTRKPFLAPPQRSSTTVGPPVSIFKKSRTRGASITSSTTARPFPQFSTIRVHYASRMPGMVPGGELVFSMEPITTTVPTTTETEEPFSDDPFTEPNQGPVVPPNDDDITLIKVAGCVTIEKGLLWHEQLNNRHSPVYREKANYVQTQLVRLFRTSPIATQVWKIQIDGFSGRRGSRSVVIDFFLYLIKSRNEISNHQLALVFQDKLINNTFSRFTLDPNKTTFEFLNEEPMRPPTEAPESSEPDPFLPQWAIAVIVVGAASLIFIVLFALVAILGRHHMRRRYSSKLSDEDFDRPGDWETKMAAAYENLAADTIYDAEDLHSDTYKKKHNATYHGRPSKPQRADSWSSSDWSPPPRRPRPQVHRIVY